MSGRKNGQKQPFWKYLKINIKKKDIRTAIEEWSELEEAADAVYKNDML